jgi:hypothetical protein
MYEKLKNLLLRNKDSGFILPTGFDPEKKRGSLTFLFAYISFTLTVVSLILLHVYEKLFVASTTTISFWVLCMVFYLLRGGLSNAKIDLKDKTIDLESDDKGNGKNDQ